MELFWKDQIVLNHVQLNPIEKDWDSTKGLHVCR